MNWLRTPSSTATGVSSLPTGAANHWVSPPHSHRLSALSAHIVMGLLLGTVNYADSELAALIRNETLRLTSPSYPIKADSEENAQIGAAPDVHWLKQKSGLTWEQFAQMLATSRRSVHYWANGGPMSAANHERLARAASVIRDIDTGSAARNRSLLLASAGRGGIILDLIARGDYVGALEAAQRAINISGVEPPPRPENTALLARLEGDVLPPLDRPKFVRVVPPVKGKRTV